MQKILVPRHKTYHYQGLASYIVFLNYNAGRKNCYDVLLLPGNHATYIGRELPLSECYNVIRCFEEAILVTAGNNWIGSQKQIKIAFNFCKELI